jgi:hypothetical protein
VHQVCRRQGGLAAGSRCPAAPCIRSRGFPNARQAGWHGTMYNKERMYNSPSDMALWSRWSILTLAGRVAAAVWSVGQHCSTASDFEHRYLWQHCATSWRKSDILAALGGS